MDSPAMGSAPPSTPVAAAELARVDSPVSANGGESTAGGKAGEQPKRRRPREAPAGWHEELQKLEATSAWAGGGGPPTEQEQEQEQQEQEEEQEEQ